MNDLLYFKLKIINEQDVEDDEKEPSTGSDTLEDIGVEKNLKDRIESDLEEKERLAAETAKQAELDDIEDI